MPNRRLRYQAGAGSFLHQFQFTGIDALVMTDSRPLVFSAVTHAGLERDNNEDSFLSLPDQGVWVVADGMGGHEAGEIASAIVRDTIQKVWIDDPSPSLSRSLQASHQAVLHASARGIGAKGMGSTVVALHSTQTEYEVAWVGDSRAYLWSFDDSDGKLELLTRDHSYVQMLVNSGAIKEEDVDSHPERNIITQCLGSMELDRVHVDTVHGQWKVNQWILLCSDGLTDEIGSAAISKLLNNNRNSVEAANRLLEAALAKGAHDNVTLQIIESPLQQNRFASQLWRWVPFFTNHRTWDAWIFTAALAALILLLIWTLI